MCLILAGTAPPLPEVTVKVTNVEGQEVDVNIVDSPVQTPLSPKRLTPGKSFCCYHCSLIGG